MTTIHLFYKDNKIWAVENLPEKPKQWDYEAGGNPPMIPAYVDPSYYDALEVYNAILKTAVEVQNPQVIREVESFHIPPDVPTIVWAKTWGDRIFKWPGKIETKTVAMLST